jgi:hypothetical protein
MACSRLIKALSYRTPEERFKVAIRYKEIHGKDLKAVMKSECGKGDFGTALQLLALPSNESECEMIMKACKGIGTNELLLYPIICGRSNKEIQILKKTFFEMNSKDLGQYLAAELGGSFEQVVVNCLQGSEEVYDPEYHTDDLVKEDLATLYRMGEGQFGTDEAGLFKILCSRPAEYLKKVNLEYADKYDVTLFKVMELEMGGDTRDATLFMLGMKLKPYETICKLIKTACKGAGTNEMLLSCTIIRYQLCLKEVMLAYTEMFGDTLQATIKSEVGGDYKRLLVEICDACL